MMNGKDIHDIIVLTNEYVCRLYIDHQSPELVFHNLTHTKNVVGRMNEIAANYSLSEIEIFILSVAAWFHDCGHLFGQAAEHEKRSVSVMRAFLEPMGVEENILQLIEQSILSTRVPYKPVSIIGEIICDADSYHLGTAEFFTSEEKVKLEFELRNKSIPPHWDEATLLLLETHVYFTAYCRSLLTEGKQHNIEFMRAKIRGKDQYPNNKLINKTQY